MSQTMYAIKKVTSTNSPNPSTTSTNKQSVTSSATSVWQKKKRKRNKNKNKNMNKNNTDTNTISDDNSSNTTNENEPPVPQAPQASAASSQTTSNNPSPNTANKQQEQENNPNDPFNNNQPKYDPSSNPYSLENYKKNHELQKKVQNIKTPNAADCDQNTGTDSNNPNPTAPSNPPPIPVQPQPTQVQSLPVTINNGPPQPVVVANTSIISNTKSPMSQVRLTPLFPTPPSNGYNIPNNDRLPPSFPPNTMSTTVHTVHTHHTHHNTVHTPNQHTHIQYLSSNTGDTDPTQCPHGNLTAEELINIKIRKRNVCYVVGLPIHVATETKLRTQEWFGQFGNIATIAINRNSKSIQANSIPAHITYDNDISALNAINFCNKFIFDDGRKLKATFGTQHYCRWFIAANKKCTNVFCGFRHSWCKPSDIITQKDINDFKAIPAGAYTSRNIENQPLGVRSVSHSHNNTPNIATTQHQSHPGHNNHHHNHSHSHHNTHSHFNQTFKQANSNNQSNNSNIGPVVQHSANIQSNDKYLRIGHSLTPSDIITSDVSKKIEADPIKISADPYTFYLSNSAATPTGPGVGQPQPQPIGGGNIPNVAVGIPNIYDSRNVLMKQIMNRNQNLQIENDRLTQQIKILSEMEIKNKQEIHRWWTELATSQQNEKNLKSKYDKLTSDFKNLELKHDDLQIKYLALDSRYKHLLNCKNAAKKKEFESWNCSDVCKWIMNLNSQKYKKYEADLCKNIKTENIDGQCLESLDKGDLHRLGVTDFKDKKDLLQKIKELVTPNES